MLPHAQIRRRSGATSGLCSSQSAHSSVLLRIRLGAFLFRLLDFAMSLPRSKTGHRFELLSPSTGLQARWSRISGYSMKEGFAYLPPSRWMLLHAPPGKSGVEDLFCTFACSSLLLITKIMYLWKQIANFHYCCCGAIFGKYQILF